MTEAMSSSQLDLMLGIRLLSANGGTVTTGSQSTRLLTFLASRRTISMRRKSMLSIRHRIITLWLVICSFTIVAAQEDKALDTRPSTLTPTASASTTAPPLTPTPDARNTERGTIVSPTTGTGTRNFVPKWLETGGQGRLGNSLIEDRGGSISIGSKLVVEQWVDTSHYEIAGKRVFGIRGPRNTFVGVGGCSQRRVEFLLRLRSRRWQHDRNIQFLLRCPGRLYQHGWSPEFVLREGGRAGKFIGTEQRVFWCRGRNCQYLGQQQHVRGFSGWQPEHYWQWKRFHRSGSRRRQPNR